MSSENNFPSSSYFEKARKKNGLGSGKFAIYCVMLSSPVCTLGVMTCPHISVVRESPGHRAGAW